MRSLLDAYDRALNLLVDHCAGQVSEEVTPSDLIFDNLTNISLTDLDSIFE
jgi:hypothetical protein